MTLPLPWKSGFLSSFAKVISSKEDFWKQSLKLPALPFPPLNYSKINFIQLLFIAAKRYRGNSSEQKRGTRGSLLNGAFWTNVSGGLMLKGKAADKKTTYEAVRFVDFRTNDDLKSLFNGYRILVLWNEKSFVDWLYSNELTTRELIFNNSWKWSQVLRSTPVTSALRGLRQEKHEIEASLVYTVRPVSKHHLNQTEQTKGVAKLKFYVLILYHTWLFIASWPIVV